MEGSLISLLLTVVRLWNSSNSSNSLVRLVCVEIMEFAQSQQQQRQQQQPPLLDAVVNERGKYLNVLSVFVYKPSFSSLLSLLVLLKQIYLYTATALSVSKNGPKELVSPNFRHRAAHCISSAQTVRLPSTNTHYHSKFWRFFYPPSCLMHSHLLHLKASLPPQLTLLALNHNLFLLRLNSRR